MCLLTEEKFVRLTPNRELSSGEMTLLTFLTTKGGLIMYNIKIKKFNPLCPLSEETGLMSH